MRFNADFHVHSRYSRATSRSCDLEHLDLFARLKGLHLVGSGDFTHPAWFAELSEKLEDAEEGLFRLKDSCVKGFHDTVRPAQIAGEPDASGVRFILTVEISSIYKRHGRVRKVHNLVFAPSLEVAAKITARLAAIGNVRSDGRPILGLDSRDLLEIVLESSEDAFLIPAHIWTPHFSMLGARSGFDSLEECFGDLAGAIFAVETGLSSDPPMNWRLSALDGLTLISNSDAHSPAKLGREANMFDTQLSFGAVKRAMQAGQSGGFRGTIEFFPEEGKYHFDGHRNCRQRMSPDETRAAGSLCSVCGRKVTLGVLHRVEELADRSEGQCPPGKSGFCHLIPLQEILGELHRVGAGSKRVLLDYYSLLERLGPEIMILKDLPLRAIEGAGPPLLREAIERMRQGRIHPVPGFDGEYGKIAVFNDDERETLGGMAQKTLF